MGLIMAGGSTLQAHAASGLPRVPQTVIAPGLSISRVIKGNWQHSGGHTCASGTVNMAHGQMRQMLIAMYGVDIRLAVI